ncbi:hypothetical protein ACP70R_016141 [Stipagrostis hirtigluma subsp. patula]
MATAAASGAAKRLIARVNVGGAAAAAASRIAPRGLHSGTQTAARSTFLSDTSGKILHEDQFVKKFDLDRAMFDHEMDMSKRLHEQNMKIIKLQGEYEITKLELERMRSAMKADIIESQTSTLYYVCAIVGVGLVAPVLFSH